MGSLLGSATLGYVAPAAGALLQEAIDVGVILNALRTTLSAAPAKRAARTSLVVASDAWSASATSGR
jgi:hypothetical protein